MENYGVSDFCEGSFCVIYIYIHISLMVHGFEPLRFASITWKDWKSSFFFVFSVIMDENYPTKASKVLM